MSDDLGPLRERLRALIREARSRGIEDELRAWFEAELSDVDPAGGATALGASSGRVDPPADPPAGRFGMIGASAAMEAVYGLVERVAPADVPVLVHGETGTGKELVARAIHEQGARKKGPFVAVNCAAIPATLLESELFGHKRGAFTGAVADRRGQFQEADGGTLFLDEIGDMPLDMQAKLLRVLQEGEVRPVGGSKTVSVDVRVVAASHRDLSAMCQEGTFREDLFFRLNVVRIDLPPLREREGDVRRLVEGLLPGLAQEVGRQGRLVGPEAMDLLEAAPWPGNVRELENELRRALALSDGEIGVGDLSPALRGPGESG